MSKIIPLKKAVQIARNLRKKNKRIVFTNGTFDILHAGHVTYLRAAKALGHVLIVGVNSDRSVKIYKSPDRPMNNEKDRMKVLAALESVDYLVKFSDPTPLALILAIQPDVLAKGADWGKNQIAGAKEVESWGGKVKRISLVKGRSTTNVIEKILKVYGK